MLIKTWKSNLFKRGGLMGLCLDPNFVDSAFDTDKELFFVVIGFLSTEVIFILDEWVCFCFSFC